MPGLRQLAFFTELAGMQTEDCDEWREVSAGLLVLRLMDSWLDIGEVVVTDPAWGVSAVKKAVAAIDEGKPVRRILDGLVDAMVAAQKPDARVVTPRLMAYAQSLDYDGRWGLAAEVYQSVVDFCDPAEDRDMMVTACLQMGVANRMVGKLVEARNAYKSAQKLAAKSRDTASVLRAEIGFAKIAIARGNFPQAQKILDKAIERAAGPDLAQVRSLALHDRAVLAIKAGENETAIRLAYTALECTGSTKDKDRILADISGAFKELGLRDAARDGYMVIAATAEEQYLRWAATLNLMEIAAADGSETVFEAYRRELSAAQLPPSLEVEYHLSTGTGYGQLGKKHVAEQALTKALALAEQYGTTDLLFAIEQEMQRLRTGVGSEPQAFEFIPNGETVSVAAAVRALREQVAAV